MLSLVTVEDRMEEQHQRRKGDHLRINLEEDVAFRRLSTGFERYRFPHCALPDVDLEGVETDIDLLGKRLTAPILISSMTGGTPEAREINFRLAEAAQNAGIAMGLGSQRAAIEDPSLEGSYQVRSVAPDILLLANLGGVQLNYGYGLEECQRAVDMIGADALILHLNPVQEALQPGGDTAFRGLLSRIEGVCRALDVPVVVKEVGWGISEPVARQLRDAGVSAIDVAGSGGSSWSRVEKHRAATPHQREVAEAFEDWGIPTVESLLMVSQVVPELPVIASGGIRNGVQIAKAVALGAVACGLAGPFLPAAAESTTAVAQLIDVLIDQLRIAMFAAGAQDIAALAAVTLLEGHFYENSGLDPAGGANGA